MRGEGREATHEYWKEWVQQAAAGLAGPQRSEDGV